MRSLSSQYAFADLSPKARAELALRFECIPDYEILGVLGQKPFALHFQRIIKTIVMSSTYRQSSAVGRVLPPVATNKVKDGHLRRSEEW